MRRSLPAPFAFQPCGLVVPERLLVGRGGTLAGWARRNACGPACAGPCPRLLPFSPAGWSSRITGGYAGRFGYKKAIAFSITVKVIAYVLMAT